ncbi:hypothetical protein OIU78_028879 [Salix suchowensis]|nr:hypothetical protein OIU78_028879 [Salix suchowensis]
MVGTYIVIARNQAVEVSKTYFNIMSSSATANASVPNKSTIKAVGGDFNAKIAERRLGKVSRIITIILVTIVAVGSMRPEISTNGRLTTLRLGCGSSRSDCVVEASVATTNKVTWKP